MISFKAIIEKFGSKGEKTGWTYVRVPQKIAEKIRPGTRKSYRVKGFIDGNNFAAAMIPMGGGDFIVCLNLQTRKVVSKVQGSWVQLKLEVDNRVQPISPLLLECLEMEPSAFDYFTKLAPSHQQYFSKWIESARTDTTKTKRIALAINALEKGWSYGEMLREQKKVNESLKN